MKIVKKLWGEERWIVNDENINYCMKEMILKSGYQSSLHYHSIKDETFYVVRGTVKLEINGVTHRLSPGDSQRIRPFELHRFRTDDDEAVFVECSTFHSDEDVTRLVDSCEI